MHIEINLPDIFLPVGLSFFVFQSCSYLLDLAKRKVEPDKNFVNIALFVSFFPTITSGPIQRADYLLPQIRSRRVLTFQRIQRAILAFLWGAFVKMVIADRLALFTNHVYDYLDSYSGITLLLCTAAYSIQIYCDFSGYSYMAIAVADLFGFDVPENFRQPYLASSIVDFWRRWHISLTSWFTEYLYIPLGGNRKGLMRKYINIAIVFLVSGLWHGAAWNFVVWGGLHAVYQITAYLTKNVRIRLYKRIGVDRDCVSYKVWQRFFIFCITSFAWIFFRADSLEQAFQFIQRMLMDWNPWILFDKSLYSMGLSQIEWKILFVALIVLIVVSFCREKQLTASDILRQNFLCKFLIFLALLLSLVIFGVYGEGYSASNFIYAGF